MRVHYHYRRRGYNGLGMLCLLILGVAAVVKLWPLAVIGLLGFFAYHITKAVRANRAKDVKRGRQILAEQKSKADTAAKVILHPSTVDDRFCTCGHCHHMAEHQIVRIDGQCTTRKCVFCSEEWTLDHSGPGQPRRVNPDRLKAVPTPRGTPPVRDMTVEEKRAQAARCLGCKGIVEHAGTHGATRNLTCGVCGQLWRPAKKTPA